MKTYVVKLEGTFDAEDETEAIDMFREWATDSHSDPQCIIMEEMKACDVCDEYFPYDKIEKIVIESGSVDSDGIWFYTCFDCGDRHDDQTEESNE
jgi:hypothetical protein